MHGLTLASRDYNDRGEVTGAVRKLADDAALAGYSFTYSFDAIGNRLAATVNGRGATYTPARLNQYVERTVPGAFDLLGEAATGATVTVNNAQTTRQAGIFSYTGAAANSLAPAYPTLNIVGAKQNAGAQGEDAVATASGRIFVPRTPESFPHDKDGNMLADGRWTYTWDAENRLIAIETAPAAVAAGVARMRLEMAYDWRHRRIQKVVRRGWTAGAYTQSRTTKYLYDEGWNVLAEYVSTDGTTFRLEQSYLWGLDLSGDRAGAGGIGGLLAVIRPAGVEQAGAYLPLYDGHGNLTGLIRATDGARVASYEYGPFGEPLRATGPMAEANPFRFSTKYADDETGLIYYGRRFYDPNRGRWLSRDPIEEQGGLNLYGFVDNDPTNFFDDLGTSKRDPRSAPQQYRLDYRVVSPIKAGNCGIWKWHVAWTLSPTTPNGGFIVQRVKRKIETFNCSGKRIDRYNKGYREAWNVSPGGGMLFGGQDIYAQGTDEHGGTSGDGQKCTKGTDEIEGRAVYYDNLGKLPGDFKPRPDHPAGDLPSTNHYGPSLPWNTLPSEASSNEVVRRVKVSWDCCNGIKKTKIEEVRP